MFEVAFFEQMLGKLVTVLTHSTWQLVDCWLTFLAVGRFILKSKEGLGADFCSFPLTLSSFFDNLTHGVSLAASSLYIDSLCWSQSCIDIGGFAVYVGHCTLPVGNGRSFCPWEQQLSSYNWCCWCIHCKPLIIWNFSAVGTWSNYIRQKIVAIVS